jgi:hypothetical protein
MHRCSLEVPENFLRFQEHLEGFHHFKGWDRPSAAFRVLTQEYQSMLP